MSGRLNFTPLDPDALTAIRAEGRFEVWRDHMTLAAAQRLARYPGRIGWHNGRPLVAGGVRPSDDCRKCGLVWMVADNAALTRRDFVQISDAWRLIVAVASVSGFERLLALGAADWPETNRWLPRLGFELIGAQEIRVPDLPPVQFNIYEKQTGAGAAHVH